MSSTKSVVIHGVAAATAAAVAFRVSRALTAQEAPKQFSVIKNEQDEPTIDDGGKVRVCPQENQDVTMEKICQRELPCFDGTMTMWGLLVAAAKRSPDAQFHGTLNDAKEWQWESYSKVVSDMRQLGRGFDRLGLIGFAKNDSSMRIFGIFGPNSSQWVKCEYAAVSRGATTVTLYNTLTKEGITHVLTLTGVRTMACLTEENAKRCLEARIDAPQLRNILVYEVTEELTKMADAAGVKLITFKEVMEEGAAEEDQASADAAEPTPKTIHTFCFTSGSTGMPKGALISHHAMVSNVAMVAARIPGFRFGQEHYLSFLPLAHQLERVVMALMISFGAAFGFSRGNPAGIMEEVALLRPTFFVAVPRLLNRLYQGISTKAMAAGGLKTKIFTTALESKLHDLTHYHHLKHPIWDAIVFKKLQKQLGFDRCRLMLTGSAPIAPQILDFLRVVFGVPVVEGYGQTEATAGLTVSHPMHFGGPNERPSHVGGPLAGVEVKLKSVPEMNYLVTDREHDGYKVIGRGEVLSRSPALMNGYFLLPEKTAATVDEEGWLHTGDIGAWMPDGSLAIVDRANNIFKTSIGEYIQPDKIERAIGRSSVVLGSFIFGTTMNARIVAIIVLNPEALPSFAEKNGVDAGDMEKLKPLVFEDIKVACRQAGLAGFEVPGAIHITVEPFSIESGVLTATSKIVRGVAKEFYRQQITDMYVKDLKEEVKI